MMLPDQLGQALEFLARQGLRPWMDSGTALGLAREGRILWEPGKDDIDISLWSENEPGLARAAKDFLAAGYRQEIWRWRGLAFKWKFLPLDPATAYPIDIKLYRRVGDHCWAPLPYHRSPPTRPMWTLWEAWRKRLLASSTERRLGEWPWWTCIGVHTFWIPTRFFEELEPWRDTPALLPRDLDGFLRLHYGDWSRPVSPWSTSMQDGSVRRGSPRRVVGRAALADTWP